MPDELFLPHNGNIKPGEDPMRRLVADAKGQPYVAFQTLQEAAADTDGVVILQGDDGGQIFIVGGIKLPAVTTTRGFSLSPDQIAALAEAMPPAHRPIVWLGALLGLRWSEVAGLRVGRIDWAAGTLRVEEAVTRGRAATWCTAAQIPGGQAPSGRADGPHGRPGRARGLPGAQSLGHRGAVVRHAARGPLSYSHWRQRVWLPACRAAGCEGAGFHDIRRANATGMVAEGVDVKVAQRRLGHADVRMTLDIYAEALETSERRASEALAARFLPVSPGHDATERTPPDLSGRRRTPTERTRPNAVRRARWTRDGKSDLQRDLGRPTG